MKISRILVFIVVFSLCFCSLAFADDLEPDSSGSSSSAISDEDMDNAIRDLSDSLYQVQLLNDTRATTYTATDIYNFMVNHFLMGGAQNGYMYQQYSTLLALNTKVQAIMSYTNSIREYTELIHDSITGDNTPITLYDLIGDHLGNIANMLAITDGDTTLSAGELLLLINNTIDDSYLALGNIQTTLDSIQNNIALLYAVMTSIEASNDGINTQATTMNANMLLMIARLQAMQDSFDNISWIDDGTSSVLGFSSTIDNAINGVYDFARGWYNKDTDLYLTITLPNGLNIYKLALNIYTNSGYKNSEINITVYNNATSSFEPLSYSLIGASSTQTQLYFYNLVGGNTYYFKLDFNVTFRVNQLTSHLYHMSLDSHDAYYYKAYIDFADFHKTLSKFEMLYASDDLIKSKEEQQPVENQIIEDFTGNGSASVSVGDAVNVKQASNAIKSGLNTGANSGLALDYAFGYNNPAGLFVWFTQDTADWFTLYQPTRGVKDYSEVIWSDEIPDHITELDNKYIRGLSND